MDCPLYCFTLPQLLNLTVKLLDQESEDVYSVLGLSQTFLVIYSCIGDVTLNASSVKLPCCRTGTLRLYFLFSTKKIQFIYIKGTLLQDSKILALHICVYLLFLLNKTAK